MTAARVPHPARVHGPIICFAVAILAAPPAAAESSQVSEVIVFGRAEHRIETATAASEGAVAGADLTVRPLLRVGELLEAVPGMIVTQHSGSGKANQYFLRGFNLDHGTDFGFFIDDVPMNFRTHGHGQGYLDVAGLIPEAVNRVDYRKGPYRADVGDFSLVGMAQATTIDDLAGFVSAEAGGFQHRRLAAGGAFDLGSGRLVLIGQAKTYDGPWGLSEHSRNLSGFAKYVGDTPIGVLRASLSLYRGRWRPTEQIPERAIGVEIPDAFGTLDPYLHGRTDRQVLDVSLTGDRWKASAYVQHYDWSMVSNFTFFLDDPVNGDEVEQAERLWTYGAKASRTFVLSDRLSLTAGGEGRYDDIPSVALNHAIRGQFDFTRSRFSVDEASAAGFAEIAWRPRDSLTITGGLRADAYSFKVRALGGSAWSGDKNDAILSPSAGVRWNALEGVALYANYGRGFHSSDARGVTSLVDPAPALVAGEGRELGVRLERGPLVLTANHWWMEVDSELIYVGDAGSVEPSSASSRHGYELTAFWRPRPWLAIDGVWTGSWARFKDTPGADHIPGALESASELGVSAVFERWNASVRVRHLGPHPLTEDNTVRAASTTIVNLRAAWTPGPFEVSAELLNALDSDQKDVEYVYASRLPGEPADGVEDVHSRAVEPRLLRVGVKYAF